MSNIMFYSIVGIIFICGVIFTALYSKLKNKKRILNLWENKSYFVKQSNIHSYNSYYKSIIYEDKNISYIDDSTWSDLQIENFMENSNYTFTTVGDEALYASLRNIEGLKYVDEDLISEFNKNKKFREKIVLTLGKLSKKQNSDSSKYLFHRYTNERYNPLYILSSISPIIGIFIMSKLFLVGIVIIFIGIALNSILYFMNKQKREFEYIDFFYAINILNTGKKLDNINHKNRKSSKKTIIISALSPLLLSDDNNEMNIFNSIVNAIKSMFFVDYHLYYFLLRIFKSENEVYKYNWNLVAKYDVNYSIALWRNTLPYYCLPMTNSENTLYSKDLYHPLIKNPISNTFTLTKDTLITGSNASGKSTFMRTLGLNILIASVLNTSTSSKFIFKTGQIYSSMNISDNLKKGDSYFVSEVKALKRIIDSSNHEKIVYCFLDELFKGTNTLERISAGQSILEYFHSSQNIWTIVATHDLELTDFLNDKFKNYHFSEKVGESAINFDYKLKKGPSNTTNAIELLNFYKLPQDIYKRSLVIKNKLNKKVSK